jgi:hypothetical protein
MDRKRSLQEFSNRRSGGAEKLVRRVDEQNLQLLPWGTRFFALEGRLQDSEDRTGIRRARTDA